VRVQVPPRVQSRTFQKHFELFGFFYPLFSVACITYTLTSSQLSLFLLPFKNL